MLMLIVKMLKVPNFEALKDGRADELLKAKSLDLRNTDIDRGNFC